MQYEKLNKKMKGKPVELLYAEEPPEEAVNPWEEYVPIIQKDNTYYVYINKDIAYPEKYAKLTFLLDTATEENEILIHLNTQGGDLYSTWDIIDSISNSRAKTVAVLKGQVSSAGTIIALHCDDLKVYSNLLFMVHTYSGGASGKSQEIEVQIRYDKKNIPKFFKSTYLGFLTNSECSKVLKGEDIYLNAEEVKERWDNMKKQKKKGRS